MERRLLSTLRPFEHNPRRIMAKPLADLTKSISKFGLAEPLVIQPDGLLIGGHARYQVLLAQGVTEADCYVPDRALSQKDMIELNVRLNKNVAGEWDFDRLANLEGVDVPDLVDWGFSEDELIGSKVNPQDEEVIHDQAIQIKPANEYIVVMCETEDEFVALRNLLKLPLVRRGGYRVGSPFDDVGIQRVVKAEQILALNATGNSI
jgi:hypothetical protein